MFFSFDILSLLIVFMLLVIYKYKSNKDISLNGYTVIIVDDIITTGASMSSCAMLIKAYKPTKVIGAALGIAYKDTQKR